jgi:hypothetical protein
MSDVQRRLLAMSVPFFRFFRLNPIGAPEHRRYRWLPRD